MAARSAIAAAVTAHVSVSGATLGRASDLGGGELAEQLRGAPVDAGPAEDDPDREQAEPVGVPTASATHRPVPEPEVSTATTTAGRVSSIGPTNDTMAVRQPWAAPPDVAANGLPPVRGAVPGSTAPTPTARPRLAKNDTTTTVSHDTGLEMTPSATLTA